MAHRAKAAPADRKALLMRANGSTVWITPKGRKFAYEELKALVGGLIERVEVGRNMDLIANEEGQLLGLPWNEQASMLSGHYIVGDVVVLRRGLW